MNSIRVLSKNINIVQRPRSNYSQSFKLKASNLITKHKQHRVINLNRFTQEQQLNWYSEFYSYFIGLSQNVLFVCVKVLVRHFELCSSVLTIVLNRFSFSDCKKYRVRTYQ